MDGVKRRIWTCSRCLGIQQRRRTLARKQILQSRTLSSTTPPQGEAEAVKNDEGRPTQEKEIGALSRRLSEMAEETMDTGSKSDRKLMHDAGFSDDLKKQLEDRIAKTSFNAQNQQALSQANMPTYAGRGTQSTASSAHWTGTEPVEDAALRMLDDAHKKLRSTPRPPRIPPKVDLRPQPKTKISRADRLANARDKTSIYAFSQQHDLTKAEREKLRKEMKERFTPGARPMPTTLQGLTSLANERIEDAISRGQFKNISRGKGVNTERDYNANSPFLDTTEYFMNKIIQKQEIVPPWIEKQQELLKMVGSFRSRLRNDWRRHVARSIASKGGSVEEQVRRAQGYALAEERENSRVGNGKGGGMKGIAPDGSLTSFTVEERVAAGVVEEVKEEMRQEGMDIDIKIEQTNSDPTASSHTTTTITPQPPLETPSQETPPSQQPSTTSDPVLPMPHPFRDPSYLSTDSAYHALAIQELNALTRSYNLMAPKIAQKPYFTLDCELKRCYADVAPTVADEIVARRNAPKHIVGLGREREGVWEKAAAGVVWKGHEGRIRDEGGGRVYGWREFWRDLWRKDQRAKVGATTKSDN